MSHCPDWLRGGDPRRIEWLGESHTDALAGLHWERVGCREGSGERIEIEIGYGNPRRARAVRITGEINETARELVGELGWLNPDPENIVITEVVLHDWSPAWRRWLHGESDTDRLLAELGLPTGGGGDAPLCRLEHVGSIGRARGGMLKASSCFVLGVIVGCLAARCFYRADPPPPGPVVGLSVSQQEDLAVLDDSRLREVIDNLYRTGSCPWPVIGFEGTDSSGTIDRTILEVAWPDCRVGVAVPEDDPTPFLRNGWTIYEAATVTEAELKAHFAAEAVNKPEVVEESIKPR